MKRIALFLALSVFILSSCKKDDDGCSLSEASIVGSYKVTSIKYKASPGVPEQDGTSLLLENCQLDDISTLQADHTFLYVDAGTSCSPNGSWAGTWSLTGNTLTITGTAGVTEAIESFNCNTVVVSRAGLTATDKFTITYTRQ